MRKLVSFMALLLAAVITLSPLSVLAASQPVPTSEEKLEQLLNIDISKFNLPTDRKIKVACVGDSITHGQDDRLHPSYPSYLQDILGDNYEVGNFGLGGTTLQSAFDENGKATVSAAYMSCEWYGKGLDFNPDVVIIMLGTNDSGDFAFKRLKEHYKKDYQTLIDSYKALPSSPTVFVATAPYLVGVNHRVNEVIVPYQREIFTELKGVDGVVDIFTWSNNREYLYTDGVHYSPEGYYSLALEFANRIFGISNGYKEYKIKAVPNAVVQLAKKNTGSVSYIHNTVADENGIATCYATDGDFTLTVRAEDYSHYKTDLSLAGGGELTCEMTAGDYNVALFRPIVASSDASEKALAENANDRHKGTLWQPRESDSTTASLVIDLGETKEIHGIAIQSWFQAYASGYYVSVSDDNESFTKVATVTDGKGNGYDEHMFESTSGRYVKINFTNKGYFFNYEIYDLQIFSNDKRTVSERETEYLAEQEKLNAQKPAEPAPVKKASPLPWLIADAVLIVIGVVAILVLRKKKT